MFIKKDLLRWLLLALNGEFSERSVRFRNSKTPSAWPLDEVVHEEDNGPAGSKLISDSHNLSSCRPPFIPLRIQVVWLFPPTFFSCIYVLLFPFVILPDFPCSGLRSVWHILVTPPLDRYVVGGHRDRHVVLLLQETHVWLRPSSRRHSLSLTPVHPTCAAPTDGQLSRYSGSIIDSNEKGSATFERGERCAPRKSSREAARTFRSGLYQNRIWLLPFLHSSIHFIVYSLGHHSQRWLLQIYKEYKTIYTKPFSFKLANFCVLAKHVDHDQ